jgi:hypothetical protein
MTNEELVENAALAIWKASALDIMGTRDLEAEWRSFGDFDKEPYVRKARVVVNMVLEEAAKKVEADQHPCLGDAKRIAAAIEAKDSGLRKAHTSLTIAIDQIVCDGKTMRGLKDALAAIERALKEGTNAALSSDLDKSEAEKRELREAIQKIKAAVKADDISDGGLSFTMAALAHIDALLAKDTPLTSPSLANGESE